MSAARKPWPLAQPPSQVLDVSVGTTIAQLQAVAMPTPFLTDWIPCTTPPVRDGVYEVQHPTKQHSDHTPFRCEFRDGMWFGVDYHPGKYLDAMVGIYQWRGVRRWVLTVPCFLFSDHPYVTHVSRRGVVYMTDKLAPGFTKAGPLGFDTEAEAAAYARRHERVLSGWKAVLP